MDFVQPVEKNYQKNLIHEILGTNWELNFKQIEKRIDNFYCEKKY